MSYPVNLLNCSICSTCLCAEALAKAHSQILHAKFNVKEYNILTINTMSQTHQGVNMTEQMPPEPAQQQPDPNACAACGSKIIEQGHLTPLCAACRDKYAKFPIPFFVKILLFLFLALSVFAFIKFPESLIAGIAFERGQRAEAAKQYKAAAEQYMLAINRFADSKIITARLGISLYKAGEYNDAIKILDPLSGKEMSKELVAEIQPIFDDFDAKVAAEKKADALPAKPVKPAKKKVKK